MADHLRLSEPSPLTSQRRRGSPTGQESPDRATHATTLAGMLEGLGLPYPGQDGVLSADADEHPEAESKLVLVFTDTGTLKDSTFRSWKMTPVAEGEDQTYMVISDADSRRFFAELVQAYGGDEGEWDNPKAWQAQLDSIGGVRLYDRTDRYDSRLESLDPSQTNVVDVLLWPSTLNTKRRREESARLRVEEVRSLVKVHAKRNASNTTLSEDPRPDSTMLRVRCDTELLEALLNNVYVERIRPPLRPEVSISHLVRATAPSTSTEPAGAPIGIIDDLITDNPLLRDVVQERISIPPEHDYGPATAHGNHIAGVAAYGDLRPFAVNGETSLPVPHPIYAARIMEQDPDAPDLAIVNGLFHERVEDAMRALHSSGVRIVTCSINDSVPDATPTPSETTAIIDTVARELGLVVVLSAGNVGSVDPHHWRDGYPDYLDRDEARVANPAGAAIAITVGARAHYDAPYARDGHPTHVAIARGGQPSPFTRTGPSRGRGTSGRAKPEFVAHGGNYGWDTLTNRLHPNDPAMSVVTTAEAGTTGGRVLSAARGTSVAAPYVAHQAAAIATRYPDASSNLIRALLALAGDRDDLDRFGDAVISAYGEPVASRVLESGTHRTVLLYEGTIPPNSTVVHTLPIPAEFAAGRFRQRIRVALAFDPPVRRSRRDYAASEMTFDVVRNMDLDDIHNCYSKQPGRNEMAEDPTLVRYALPNDRRRMDLTPKVSTLSNSTLVCRGASGAWDPDDEGYFLVVSHRTRPWAKNEVPEEQAYAIAVELSLETEARIDLTARIADRLIARQRVRLTGR